MGRQFILAAIGLTIAVLISLSGGSASAATTFTVNSTVDPGDSVCDVTECTLREAIDAANASAGLDVINFDATVFPPGAPATIAVTSQLPKVEEALTIDGSGAGVVLEPAVPVDSGLFVQDTDPAADTDFALIGNSFTIQGFDMFGIFVCGYDGVSPQGCGTGPVSNVSITGATISSGEIGVQVGGDSNMDVFIDGNVSISGDAEGVAFAGATSNSSVSDNGPIRGGNILGVRFDGLSLSDIAIDGNASITGGDVGVLINGGDINNVSVSGNTEITAAARGVGVDGDSISNVSVDGNGLISGDSDSGIAITGGNINDVGVTNNDEITSAGTAIAIWGTTNTAIVVSSNGSISGGHEGVDVTGTTNTDISVDSNASITGAGDSGAAINGVTNINISVSWNGSIAGAFVSGDSVLVTADVTNRVRVVGNASVTSGTAGFGIVVEGAVSNRNVVINGNRVNAGLVGIGVIGANPGGARNLVSANVVEAATPDAVFGIVLFAAERNRVAFNQVSGFEGEIEGIGGGGIGVLFGSSYNHIQHNVVDSEPDLFWDETGTKNRWTGNICDTSVPLGLCR